MNWLDLINSVATPLMIGAGGAFLGARFALQRFRSEKIWEKRLQSYSELINALHNMKRARERLIEIEDSRDLVAQSKSLLSQSDFQKMQDDLWARSRESRRDVERAADQATFIITERIGQVLEEFESDMQAALSKPEKNTWLSVLTDELSAVNKCLAAIKSIAASELKT